MFSRAIFEVTMRRFLHWTEAIAIASILIGVGGMAGAMSGSGQRVPTDIAQGILFGPVIPFLMGFPVVGAQIANSAQTKTGEYLALLFTRPISKWEYVFTKWACGSLFLLIGMALMAIIGTLAQRVTAFVFDVSNPAPLVDAYSLVDGFLNIFSVMAVVVLFSSLPRKVFLMLYVFLVYSAMFVVGFMGFFALTTSFVAPTESHIWTLLVQLTLGLFTSSIDSYHLVNSAESPVASGLVFVSNIVLRLTLAAAFLSIREYFYAND